MDDTAIMLKGTSDGILLRPKSSDWEAVLAAFEEALGGSRGVLPRGSAGSWT